MVNSLSDALTSLKSPNALQRLEAAQYLADRLAAPDDAPATEALLAALGDPDPRTNEALIHALAGKAEPLIIGGLVAILRENHPARRNASLSALIEIGSRQPASLVSALAHSTPEVRLHIAEVLGDLRNPESVTALMDRLSDDTEFPNVRHAAAQALGKIGDRAATPALIQAAEQGDFWVRYAAVEALGKIGDERAVTPLLALMQQDAWTRPAIVQALGNIEQVEAAEALVGALDDPNEAVRAASMEALIKIVIEPGTARRVDAEKLARLRELMPVSTLVRELKAGAEPSSIYAAHLIGWLTAPEALPDLVVALGHPDETLRYAAVESILRYSHTAVPALLAALNNPEALVRENAAELLGMQAEASAVPALVARLADDNLDVRQAALRALGSVNSDAAYEGLLQALADPATLDTALGVLGQLRDASRTNNFKEYLQHYLYAGAPATRRAAALALSLFGDEFAVSILLNATRLLDDSIRQPAADALARVRGNRAVSALIEALGDRDALVRQKVVEALSYIPDGRAITALLQAVHDPDWRVRKALILALSHIKDARIYAALDELARDSDHWLRRAVMDLCTTFDDSRVVEILLTGLNDPDFNVRRTALIALGRRREKAALGVMTQLLTDASPIMRVIAVRVAAQIGEPRALEHLSLLAHDPVDAVRFEVADALGDLGDEEGIDALEVLLRDGSAEVRQHAAQALAHIGTLPAAEALTLALTLPLPKAEAQAQLATLGEQALRALLGTARSSDALLRAAAAESLGQLKSPHAVPTLKQLLRDSDGRVRQAAEGALKAMEAN